MKTKKLLSWLISGSMLLSAVPVMTASAEDNTGYTSVKVSPATFSNYTRNYYIAGNSSWYKASDGYSISRDDFMAMDIWDNDWADAATYVSGTGGYKIDNSLTLNGISYEIRTTFKSNDKTSDTSTGVPASMRTMSISTAEKYYATIDVEDGFYKGVSFLGGRDGWGSMPYIRYNYVDGTKSNWVQLTSKKLDQAPETGDVYIKVQGLDWDSTAGAAKKTYTVTAEDGTTSEEDLYLYLYQINDFSVDYKKTVSTIDVLASAGAVEKDTSNEPTKNSNAYASSALFIGMTMLQDEETAAYSKIAEMKEILDTLPPAVLFEATTENVNLLTRLTELVEETDPALLDEAASEVYYEALEYTQYDFETGYVSVTQNIVDKAWANGDRAYAVGGGGFLAESGTTKYTISGDSFVALSGWKYDWADVELEGSKDAYGYKDNIFTLNGIDYEVTIPFKRHEEGVSTSSGFNDIVKTEGYAGSEGNPYYVTYDVDDGYYKGVSFLGGSLANNPYIRYVYESGEKSDWSLLDYEASFITAPAEGQKAIKTVGNSWTYIKPEGEDGVTSDIGTVSEFYLYQMSNENADINQKTVAIEIISHNGKLPEVDGTVDVNGEPVFGKNWQYRLLFVGMTLLTNRVGNHNVAVDEMNAILSKLPGVDEIDGTNIDDLDLIVELKSFVENIIPDLLSAEELESYNEAKAYSELAELISDEYAWVEPSRFVNSPNAYYIDGTAANQGNAYSGTAIYAPDFKAMNIWDNAWTSDMTENVLTFNGYKYKLRVTGEKGVQVTYAPNRATSVDDAYKRIALDAGYYNNLSLLGGVEYNGSAGAVRLNYLDGTTSGFINLEGAAKLNTGNGLSVTRYTWNATEGNYSANGNIILHQYNVAVDGTKLLGSIDIPAVNAEITDGVITDVMTVDEYNTAIAAATTDAEKNAIKAEYNKYNSRWFGFGFKLNGILKESSKEVVKTINPDLFVNYNRTYMGEFNGTGITNNYGINWEKFITLSNWKNEWSTSTGVEDNTFKTDSAEYLVRMDRGTGKNNTFASQAGTEIGYTTIDIEDGYYLKMMFLGGATNHGGSMVGVQFNYSDGTTSGFLTQSSGGNITASADNAIAVGAIKSAKGSDSTYTYEDTTLYLREYEFVNPDAYKKVVSVSIPYRNVTIADGVLTPMSSTGGSGAYTYDVRWLGMSVVTNRVLSNHEIVDESTEPIVITASAEGSDDNNGVDAPVKTFAAAVSKAKEINAISVHDRDVNIILEDGEYEVTETVTIDSFRGNVKVMAAEGANPVIKGSKTLNIADMTDYNDIDAPVSGIKSVDLSAYGMTGIKNDAIVTSNNSIYATYTFGVFSEDSILPIAEYPNGGEMVEEAVINTKAGDTISIENENFLYYADENLYLEGYLVENYRTYTTNSFEIDGSVLAVNPEMLAARTMYGLTRNWRIFNSLALLDTAGEWYLDKATMTLYYLPKSGETSVEISNMTDALVKVLINNVTFDGIEFKNTCANAIETSDVSGLTIKNSSFEAIGRNAISASNVTETLIKDNKISDVGYRGIYISGGNEKTLKASGNIVEGNTIERPGRIVRCYSPAVTVAGVGNVIENNYFADSRSMLVNFSGSLNKIVNNEIINAAKEAKDLGAVYGGRNLTYLGNEIAYNHISNFEREEAEDNTIVGVYLDDGMSGTKIYNNIIENADRGVFANGGALNTINNNLLINCKRGIVTGANPISGFTADYDSANTGVSLTKYAELYFAANPAYAENFKDLDLTKLTVDAAEFKASASVSGNRFMDCDENWDNAAYENGTANDTSDDVYAEVSGEDNVTVESYIEGLAQADIDTNDIGLAKSGLDTEIAWAKVENDTVTVYFVSTYEDLKVMAAVKDSQGKLIAVKTVADGESFNVSGAAIADIFVFDSLENLKPMTK